MTLEDALKKAAHKIWDELEPVPANPNYDIKEIREEGLTTMALKELAKSSCPEIDKIIMIPPKEEKKAGYDFELAIGSKLTGKYIRLFIQAKTLKGKKIDSQYKEIDFAQATSLNSYAKSKQSLGLYSFFNNLSENSLVLKNHYNSITPYKNKNLGITIASAYTIRMLRSKVFSDYHFNNGLKTTPRMYYWRHFSHLFYFHKDSKSHLAVPFHELAFFTTEMAEMINRRFKEIRQKGKANFFFFFFPGIEESLNNDEDLIPIINTNIEELISEFKRRAEETENDMYNPQALIIIDTGINKPIIE